MSGKVLKMNLLRSVMNIPQRKTVLSGGYDDTIYGVN